MTCVFLDFCTRISVCFWFKLFCVCIFCVRYIDELYKTNELSGIVLCWGWGGAGRDGFVLGLAWGLPQTFWT